MYLIAKMKYSVKSANTKFQLCTLAADKFKEMTAQRQRQNATEFAYHASKCAWKPPLNAHADVYSGVEGIHLYLYFVYVDVSLP